MPRLLRQIFTSAVVICLGFLTYACLPAQMEAWRLRREIAKTLPPGATAEKIEGFLQTHTTRWWWDDDRGVYRSLVDLERAQGVDITITVEKDRRFADANVIGFYRMP